MKLPVIDTYAFSVTLPSSSQTIMMRPYLVREEKLLLMAQESGNYDEQSEAVAQTIRNCTNNQVDPRVVPYFDIEYLLLQLRAKSVGEIASPIYVCHQQIDGKECGHKTPVSVNLLDATVNNLTRSPEDFILKLSDQYTLHLRYPTVYTIHQLLTSTIEKGRLGSAPFMSAICDVFDVLEDHTSGNTYNFSEYTSQERLEFLESLSTRNYEELIAFLDSLPTVEKEVTFTCGACQFEHTIKLSGVTDFLV